MQAQPGAIRPEAIRPDTLQLLNALRQGEADAINHLFPRLYDALRAIARQQKFSASPTLCTTALVHEAYLKLVDQERVTCVDRHHFLEVAARAMRQVLVDDARRRGAAKRGGGAQRVELKTLDEPRIGAQALDVVALDAALSRLARLNPRLSRVAELRLFGGLSLVEVAQVLAVTPRTVTRDLRVIRHFFKNELDG